MILHKFYLKCLAHGSYLFADDQSGRAAVVDPQRDVDQYLALLGEDGLELKYVLETHVHADFVSGYRELVERTGAELVFGARSGVKTKHLAVRDGDELHLGPNVAIRVLETPGHTPESVCYLVTDRRSPEGPPTLFSGDTLFVGEVGRPDLLGARMSARDLAAMLYDSLHGKLERLPPNTVVYPAHGAGSACGRNIGTAAFTTIGDEFRTNYALQAMDKERFIELVTADLPEAPPYFSEDAALNRQGARSLEEVVDSMRAMDPEEFERRARQGALVLDTRSADAFAQGSIPGALFIGLDGQFASWVGTLVPKDASLLFLCDEGREEEAAVRCARVGHDSVAGFLAGGLEAWKRAGKPVLSYERVEAAYLPCLPDEGRHLLLDVRRPAERRRESIGGSEFLTLSRLAAGGSRLPRDRRIVAYCASGYRSAVAVSVLRRLGYADVTDMRGGLNACSAAGLAPDTGETGAQPSGPAGPDGKNG